MSRNSCDECGGLTDAHTADCPNRVDDRAVVVAEAIKASADLAGYIRDARSTENPCEHWVGQAIAVCAPCLRDRIAPHVAAAILSALDGAPNEPTTHNGYRLSGKREGVMLARSYAEEALREIRADTT